MPVRAHMRHADVCPWSANVHPHIRDLQHTKIHFNVKVQVDENRDEPGDRARDRICGRRRRRVCSSYAFQPRSRPTTCTYTPLPSVWPSSALRVNLSQSSTGLRIGASSSWPSASTIASCSMILDDIKPLLDMSDSDSSPSAS